jgi:hypothetical protein
MFGLICFAEGAILSYFTVLNILVLPLIPGVFRKPALADALPTVAQ